MKSLGENIEETGPVAARAHIVLLSTSLVVFSSSWLNTGSLAASSVQDSTGKPAQSKEVNPDPTNDTVRLWKELDSIEARKQPNPSGKLGFRVGSRLSFDAEEAFAKGDFQKASEYYAKLARKYKASGNWYPAANALLKRTESLLYLQDNDNASKCMDLALEYFSKTGCTEKSINGKLDATLALCLSRSSTPWNAEFYADSAIRHFSEARESMIYELALATHQKAQCLADRDKVTESDKLLQESIKYFKQLSDDRRREISLPLTSLARSLNRQARYKEAETVCREGLKLGQEWGFDTQRQQALYRIRLAIALSHTPDQGEEIAKNLQEAFAIGNRAEVDNEWVLNMYRTWIENQILLKHFQSANEWIEKGFEFASKHNLASSATMIYMYRDKARCEIENQKLDDALTSINEAARVCSKQKDPTKFAPDIASSLAVIYHKQKNWEAELDVLDRLQKMQLKDPLIGPAHSEIAITLRRKGNAHFQMDHLEEADSLFQQALIIEEKKKGPEDLSLASQVQEIGTTFCITGRHEQAIPYLIRGISIRDKHGDTSKGPYGLEGNIAELASLYMAMKKPEKALPLVERLLDLQNTGKGPSDDVDAVAAMQTLAGSYFAAGKAAEAQWLMDRVAELLKTEKWKNAGINLLDLQLNIAN